MKFNLKMLFVLFVALLTTTVATANNEKQLPVD